MNSSDVEWLEKIFEQHKEDQQKYLDEKFRIINDKLDIGTNNCEVYRTRCIERVDKCLECHTKDIKDVAASSTRKAVIAGAASVIITLLLWTAFGTEALDHVLTFLGFRV